MLNDNTDSAAPDIDEVVRKVAIALQVAILRVEVFNFLENDHAGEYVGVLHEDELAFLDELIECGPPTVLFEAAVERYWINVDEIAERVA